jgi:hypothetical protein
MKIQKLTLAALIALMATFAPNAAEAKHKLPKVKAGAAKMAKAPKAARLTEPRDDRDLGALRLEQIGADRARGTIDLDRPSRVALRIASNVRAKVLVVNSGGQIVVNGRLEGRSKMVNDFEVLLPAGRSTIIICFPARNPLLERQLAATATAVDAPQIESELSLNPVPPLSLPFNKHGKHPKRNFPTGFTMNKGR